MRAHSGVLLVAPRSGVQSRFPNTQVANTSELLSHIDHSPPQVLVFDPGSIDDLDAFTQNIENKAPLSQWIVIDSGLQANKVMVWQNSGRLSGLSASWSDPHLDTQIQNGLERFRQTEQNENLIRLLSEQSQKLTQIKQTLATKVEKRSRTLKRAITLLQKTHTKLITLHKTLVAIQRANSLPQIEESLSENLQTPMDLEWARIRYMQQSSPPIQWPQPILQLEIPVRNSSPKAEVWFAKKHSNSFTDDERENLAEIADALSLALSRLQKLEEAEILKGQWQSTFDSIPHPLCLVTENFQIIKLNNAFRQASGQKKFIKYIGQNCFEIFFGSNPTHAHVAESKVFRVLRPGKNETDHYEVVVEPLGVLIDQNKVALVVFRNVTNEARFERRIFEVSKLAELGTVGSSIAHELNNPLGGMLSYLQLILMDLPKSHPQYNEVKAMEAGTLKCRDIVQNLLSFARKQEVGQKATLDLDQVIRKSIQILDLQAKPRGIKIRVNSHNAMAVGNENSLVQAICNILQNALDAIEERRKSEPDYSGEVSIQMVKGTQMIEIQISDDGMGIPMEVQNQIFHPLFTTRNPDQYRGMGLTTALAIVTDHDGSLEIRSARGSGTTAVVYLPVLDLPPERQDFDGEI